MNHRHQFCSQTPVTYKETGSRNCSALLQFDATEWHHRIREKSCEGMEEDMETTVFVGLYEGHYGEQPSLQKLRLLQTLRANMPRRKPLCNVPVSNPKMFSLSIPPIFDCYWAWAVPEVDFWFLQMLGYVLLIQRDFPPIVERQRERRI